MTIHVFFAFPETAGKSLEEVESMFLSRIPAWKTKIVTKKMAAQERGDIEAKPEATPSIPTEPEKAQGSTAAVTGQPTSP